MENAYKKQDIEDRCYGALIVNDIDEFESVLVNCVANATTQFLIEDNIRSIVLLPMGYVKEYIVNF